MQREKPFAASLTALINMKIKRRKANWKKYSWTSDDHGIVDIHLLMYQHTIPEKVFDSAHYFSTLFGDDIIAV